MVACEAASQDPGALPCLPWGEAHVVNDVSLVCQPYSFCQCNAVSNFHLGLLLVDFEGLNVVHIRVLRLDDVKEVVASIDCWEQLFS